VYILKKPSDFYRPEDEEAFFKRTTTDKN